MKDETTHLSDAEETGLMIQYHKAVESECDNLIIHDEKAVAVAQKLDLFNPTHS